MTEEQYRALLRNESNSDGSGSSSEFDSDIHCLDLATTMCRTPERLEAIRRSIGNMVCDAILERDHLKIRRLAEAVAKYDRPCSHDLERAVVAILAARLPEPSDIRDARELHRRMGGKWSAYSRKKIVRLAAECGIVLKAAPGRPQEPGH